MNLLWVNTEILDYGKYAKSIICVQYSVDRSCCLSIRWKIDICELQHIDGPTPAHKHNYSI